MRALLRRIFSSNDEEATYDRATVSSSYGSRTSTVRSSGGYGQPQKRDRFVELQEFEETGAYNVTRSIGPVTSHYDHD